MRVGIGRDLHKLVSGRTLILGGIIVPFEKGEDAHSDGDVLTHAIIDAILAAAALGDIGELFPPNDDKWKDADSLELLKIAYSLVVKKGWQIENIDSVISIENPKILPFRDKIRNSLACTLNLDAQQVFVKAKTGEGLGDIGEGRAVEAIAVCLLKKTPSL